MKKAETGRVAVSPVSWWRWAFVGVVMFSLVLALATRTFPGSISRAASSRPIAVQSDSPQVMGQHMDRDAIRWAAPVAVIVESQAPTFYPRVAPAGPPLPVILLEDNLYNRPPPFC